VIVLAWIGLLVSAVALAAFVVIRRRASAIALRAVHQSGARIDRYKLTRKAFIKATLLADESVAEAVRAHASEVSIPEEDTWRKVESYIDEIVPFFNILTYYKVGIVFSRIMLNFFYKVSAEHSGPANAQKLRRDAVIIYLMNHRSNADYVLVGYVLSGQVAISYAVGEWARTFPLEYIFKSFGAYFIRRRYREKLYHTVLERYVQLITRNGVTQGIFLEGGLSRDGKLAAAKIGLLDYILGVARDRAMRERLYVVPVAINYDRVLEDRSLIRELDVREGRRAPPRRAQLLEVARYVWWNLARLVARKWKRYGRAAVVIGTPIPLKGWFDAQDEDVGNLFEVERHARLERIQNLADSILQSIAAIVPVTPVSLACAAIQSFDGDFIPRPKLLSRMSEMRDVLTELNARVIHHEGSVEEIFDRAWRMLRMRRMLVESGGGYAVLPGNRPLISYYANSIAHLLGPFSDGVRQRDALPALAASNDVKPA
jgi:glycerol-3-phosphate O-acyltransferase